MIWPLLFVGLLTRFKRATPTAVLVTSLGLATVSSALMIVLYDPARTNRVYFGTDTRAAAILFGAALAAWFSVRGPARSVARIALEVAGVAGAVVLAIGGRASTANRPPSIAAGSCSADSRRPPSSPPPCTRNPVSCHGSCRCVRSVFSG